jgi:hypothetical protein
VSEVEEEDGQTVASAVAGPVRVLVESFSVKPRMLVLRGAVQTYHGPGRLKVVDINALVIG